MVHREPEKLHVLRTLQKGNNGGITTPNLFFDLGNGKLIDIGMGVRVIAQFQTLCQPLLENVTARIPQCLRALSDHESRHRTSVLAKCLEQLLVHLFRHGGIRFRNGPCIGNIRKIVNRDCHRALLCERRQAQ